MEIKKNWYAVYTKPRWEKKVAAMLLEKGIENYCPINKVIRQWSDRKKMVMEPVFKGYVFVKLEDNKKWQVKDVNGILNFVYWLGKWAIFRSTLSSCEETKSSRSSINLTVLSAISFVNT